jgi:hypothetical protein
MRFVGADHCKRADRGGIDGEVARLEERHQDEGSQARRLERATWL